MTKPEEFMPDDLIRTRNWADLTLEEKLALKDIAATEEEFRLLKLMLSTTAVQEDVPAINPAVQEQLKTAFREEHAATPRIRVIAWWKYAAAAAVVMAVAGTIWITSTKNKNETVVAGRPKETVQPVIKDTAKPLAPVPDTTKKTINTPLNPRPETGPVKPPRLRLLPPAPLPQKNTIKQPAPDKLPVIEPEPNIAANINTSLKENGDLLQLVAAVY